LYQRAIRGLFAMVRDHCTSAQEFSSPADEYSLLAPVGSKDNSPEQAYRSPGNRIPAVFFLASGVYTRCWPEYRIVMVLGFPADFMSDQWYDK
jgi:hypothetical protein